jgi:hypothetical protein
MGQIKLSLISMRCGWVGKGFTYFQGIRMAGLAAAYGAENPGGLAYFQVAPGAHGKAQDQRFD